MPFRRRPVLRTAAIAGGAAYAGKKYGESRTSEAALEADQEARLQQLEAQQTQQGGMAALRTSDRAVMVALTDEYVFALRTTHAFDVHINGSDQQFAHKGIACVETRHGGR